MRSRTGPDWAQIRCWNGGILPLHGKYEPTVNLTATRLISSSRGYHAIFCLLLFTICRTVKGHRVHAPRKHAFILFRGILIHFLLSPCSLFSCWVRVKPLFNNLCPRCINDDICNLFFVSMTTVSTSPASPLQPLWVIKCCGSKCGTYLITKLILSFSA